jgi:hypothetical protein
MYQQVQKAIIQTIQFAQFLACTCDEAITIDNGSWICVHAYGGLWLDQSPYLNMC